VPRNGTSGHPLVGCVDVQDLVRLVAEVAGRNPKCRAVAGPFGGRGAAKKCIHLQTRGAPDSQFPYDIALEVESVRILTDDAIGAELLSRARNVRRHARLAVRASYRWRVSARPSVRKCMPDAECL